MSRTKRILVGIGLVSAPFPALARIESVTILQCRGVNESFAIRFDHGDQRAIVSHGTELDVLHYEPQGAFQTWRLLDENQQQHYVLKQGDVLNGDFGWYFSYSSVDAEGSVKTEGGGECRSAE